MRGIYSIYFTGTSITAPQDLFEVTPADDRPVEIAGLFLSQESDVGDAQEEILRYNIVRGNSTPGSGGVSVTPNKISSTDISASFTAAINNTAIANGGAPQILHADTFNIRTGLQIWFPPECSILVRQVETLIVVRLNSTPADALVMSGTLYLREL